MSSHWYDRHILPRLLETACGLPQMAHQRRQLVPLARGRVLEVGIGTGLNLPWYDKTRISHITGLDPALALHPRARRRIAETGLAVDMLGVSAEQIPSPDASFDTVVMTWTLCSIPDPLAALREMRRVLKPDGTLLFCEHGRAPQVNLARWQDRLQPIWGRLAGGCHLTRNVPMLLDSAGFNCPDLTTGYLGRPKVLTWHFWGQARAKAAGSSGAS